MKVRKDGRGKLSTLNPDATEVVNGQQSLDDWDDEELMRGRRRNRRGDFRGPDAAVIPAAMVRELQRRRFAKAHALLAHSLVDAVKLLQAVVNDERAPRATRMKAAREILNRVLGKPAEQVNIGLHGPEGEGWRDAIAHAIVGSVEDDDVVEGEVVEE